MENARRRTLAPILVLWAFNPSAGRAQQSRPPVSPGSPADPVEGPMPRERPVNFLRRLNPRAQMRASVWQLTVAESRVIIVMFDVTADRMRALVPVRPAQGITAAEMTRMMQADSGTALDARHAIAQNTRRAAFIPCQSWVATSLSAGLARR